MHVMPCPSAWQIILFSSPRLLLNDPEFSSLSFALPADRSRSPQQGLLRAGSVSGTRSARTVKKLLTISGTEILSGRYRSTQVRATVLSSNFWVEMSSLLLSWLRLIVKGRFGQSPPPKRLNFSKLAKQLEWATAGRLNACCEARTSQPLVRISFAGGRLQLVRGRHRASDPTDRKSQPAKHASTELPVRVRLPSPESRFRPWDRPSAPATGRESESFHNRPVQTSARFRIL